MDEKNSLLVHLWVAICYSLFCTILFLIMTVYLTMMWIAARCFESAKILLRGSCGYYNTSEIMKCQFFLKKTHPKGGGVSQSCHIWAKLSHSDQRLSTPPITHLYFVVRADIFIMVNSGHEDYCHM